jgi:hypothetical protein
MKKLLIILITFFWSGSYMPSYAQDLPYKYMDGWKAAKWGMTENEILKKVKGAKQAEIPNKWDNFGSSGPAYSPVVLEGVTIDNIVFKASFILDNKTKKLIAVQLQAPKNAVDFLTASNLEKLLIEKYGAPSYRKEEKEDGQTLTVNWDLSKTVVELGFIQTSTFDFFDILYKRKDKISHDNL